DITPPSGLQSHAMAYDSARARVVVFGGQNSDQQRVGSTFVWDGVVWTRPSNSGPPARTGHAMAYDSIRGRVVLSGGEGLNDLGDPWDWDGFSWSQRSSTGPSPL